MRLVCESASIDMITSGYLSKHKIQSACEWSRRLKYRLYDVYGQENQVIQGRGTPGFGDACRYLHIAHMYSAMVGAPITLEMHWDHDEDFLFYEEDPETIVERLDYVHQFYLLKDRVNLVHKFNSQTPLLDAKRIIGAPDTIEVNGLNRWKFDPRFNQNQTRDQNKVVVWRSAFNAQPARFWKDLYDPYQWNDSIIGPMVNQGYNVVEIDYRTPIREVMYHLYTCGLVICYEGMWHYLAHSMATPMIVIAAGNVTRTHTPNALHYGKRHSNILEMLFKEDYSPERNKYELGIEKLIEETKISNMIWDIRIGDAIGEYRQSGN